MVPDEMLGASLVFCSSRAALACQNPEEVSWRDLGQVLSHDPFSKYAECVWAHVLRSCRAGHHGKFGIEKHKDFMPMFMWQPCFEHLLCVRHCAGDKDMNKGGSFGVTEKHHSVGALRRPLPRCQGRLPGGGSLHWILTKEGKSARIEGWRPSCG